MLVLASKSRMTSFTATLLLFLCPSLSYGIVTSLGGASVNDLLGADVFYDHGITGQGAILANVEMGHIWSGHESLGHVSEFFHHEDAFGETTEDLFDRHATLVASMMGGRPVDDTPENERQRGIAFGADLRSGAVASEWLGEAYSRTFDSVPNSVATPYQHFFGSADVINSSWNGTGVDGNSRVNTAFDGFVAGSDTTFVATAGNFGPAGTPTSPAIGYNVISVGALANDGFERYDSIADFSSRGPLDYEDPINGLVPGVRAAVDITAPGNELTGAYYGGATGGNNPTLPGSPNGLPGGPDSYNHHLWGTSVAAPITAGAATLLKSASYNDPVLAPNPASRDTRIVKAVLLNSADKTADWDNGQTVSEEGVLVTTQGLDFTYGAGALNIGESYEQFLGGDTQDVPGESTGDLGLVDTIGWDFGEVALDGVNTYALDDSLLGGSDFTATLSWYRDRSAAGVPGELELTDDGQADLNLRLVDAESGAVVAESSSRYNVVEHFHFSIPETAEYLLEVSFDGALFGDFESEQYGLAWSGSAAAVPEPADLNSDGFVDGLDLGVLLANFDQHGISASGGELNDTDAVDGLDLGILLGAWNAPIRPATASVPEPNTLMLAVLFAVAGVTGTGRWQRRSIRIPQILEGLTVPAK